MLLIFFGGVKSVDSEVTEQASEGKASVTDPQGLELGIADGSG